MSLVPLVTNSGPNASIFAPIGGSSVQRVLGESLYTDPSTIYTDPSTITTSSVTINSLGGVYGNISLGIGTPYGLNITSHIRLEQLPINIPNGASVSSLTVDTINGLPFGTNVASSITVSSFTGINASISSMSNVSILVSPGTNIVDATTDSLNTTIIRIYTTGNISTLTVSTLVADAVFNTASTIEYLNVLSTLDADNCSLNRTLFCNCTQSTLSSINNTLGTELTNPGATLSYLTDIVGVAGDATQYTGVNYFSTVTDPYFNYGGLPSYVATSTILTFNYKGVNQAENNEINSAGNLAIQKMYFVEPIKPINSTPYISQAEGGGLQVGGIYPSIISSLIVSSINGVPQSAIYAGPAFEEAVRSAFANMVFSTINVSSINSGPP